MKSISPLVALVKLETGGTQQTAHIFTIGLIIGNVLTKEILDEHYVRLSHVGQEKRTTDDSTMQNFWGDPQKVSEEARNEVFNQSLTRYSVVDALIQINNRIAQYKDQKPAVFGNGSEFTNAILQDIMAANAIVPAWSFWQNESLRTAVWMCRLVGVDPKDDVPFVGTRYHALHDARWEFNYLCAIVENYTSWYEHFTGNKSNNSGVSIKGDINNLFVDEKSKYLFILNSTDGKTRCDLLGVQKKHYADIKLADEWKSNIRKVLLSNDDNPEETSNAVSQLDKLHTVMADSESFEDDPVKK